MFGSVKIDILAEKIIKYGKRDKFDDLAYSSTKLKGLS